MRGTYKGFKNNWDTGIDNSKLQKNRPYILNHQPEKRSKILCRDINQLSLVWSI